jgi:hypothetical protein
VILRWLISAIGFAALKGEVSSVARRVGNRALLVALLALLWVTAFGLALAALTVWLSALVGVAAACGIVATGVALVGLIILLVMIFGNRTESKAAPVGLPFPGLTANPGGTPRIDGSSLGSMAVVAIAGYLLGRQLFR